MNLPITVTQEDLLEILINVAPIRPVFIWGAPGIGKSALVEQFAKEVGLPCVSLLGSQLAPEDIIGIPRINGETSEFLPPKMIARTESLMMSSGYTSILLRSMGMYRNRHTVLIRRRPGI